jgi:DNA-binding XRE family transcriptional regulator
VLKKEEADYYRRLGQRIKTYRGKIKQEAVAQVLGLTRISVSNIENGKQRIQLHTLAQLAQYLKVDVSDIIPPLHPSSEPISNRLEKHIAKSKAEINSESMGKVADFVKLSVTTISQNANKRQLPKKSGGSSKKNS